MTQLRNSQEALVTRPATEGESATTPAARLTGEVVYLYAFDIAWEFSPIPDRELLGQPVGQFVVDASKRRPRQMLFYKPQMVRLPPLERLGPHGPLRVERTVKFLPVGAISITVRVPFEVDSCRRACARSTICGSATACISTTKSASSPRKSASASSRTASGRSRSSATRRRTPSSASTAPLADSDGDADQRRGRGCTRDRREIAALLTEEPDPHQLSRPGSRRIDRQVFQLLRARPRRHRLGRRHDRRRATVF